MTDTQKIPVAVSLSDPMLLALLEGRKTQFRVPLFPQPPTAVSEDHNHLAFSIVPAVSKSIGFFRLEDHATLPKEPGVYEVLAHDPAPYNASAALQRVEGWCGQTEWTCPFGVPGDHLWVKEDYAVITMSGIVGFGEFEHLTGQTRQLFTYRVGNLTQHPPSGQLWVPFVDMPMEHSRILLKVSGVRVERIQSITEAEARACGFSGPSPRDEFMLGWNVSNPSYSWRYNPYVWVIDFTLLQIKGSK